jgi:hypothetical protein
VRTDPKFATAFRKGWNMNWYCIQIAQKRYAREADTIFRDMLRHERRTRDADAECKVYYVPKQDGGHYYYFTPDAADRYRVFVNFWSGAACLPPADLMLAAVV